VTFAQSMIVHHRQALEMSALAAERTEREEVREFAAGIEAAQGPEMKLMSGRLERWGQDMPSGGDEHAGMDMSDKGDIEMRSGSGMTTDEQMSSLADASGAEFDGLFLELMIEHHEGAVAMAQAQLEEGAFPEALAVAEEIIAVQQDEIPVCQGEVRHLRYPII
jgi:uncharacterized protein (DUF305 family)